MHIVIVLMGCPQSVSCVSFMIVEGLGQAGAVKKEKAEKDRQTESQRECTRCLCVCVCVCMYMCMPFCCLCSEWWSQGGKDQGWNQADESWRCVFGRQHQWHTPARQRSSHRRWHAYSMSSSCSCIVSFLCELQPWNSWNSADWIIDAESVNQIRLVGVLRHIQHK